MHTSPGWAIFLRRMQDRAATRVTTISLGTLPYHDDDGLVLGRRGRRTSHGTPFGGSAAIGGTAVTRPNSEATTPTGSPAYRSERSLFEKPPARPGCEAADEDESWFRVEGPPTRPIAPVVVPRHPRSDQTSTGHTSTDHPSADHPQPDRLMVPAPRATTPVTGTAEEGATDAPEQAPVDAAASRRAAAGKRALSDGLSLSISGAVGSLAGFISWLIAARLMPQEAVGYASAFVSAFLLVAGVAQLNLDSAMMLWMPKAGRMAATLFWRSHAVIVVSCAVVGVVYVLLTPQIAETGAGPGIPVLVGGLFFVLAGIGWGLWGIHDFSLIAIGKTWWASWRNIAFAVARIGLLLALGASLGPQGVVLSWVVPIVVWTVGSAVIGGVFTRQFSRHSTQQWLPSRSETVKFLGPTTLAHWGTVLLFNQVTVIVVQRFGAATGAAFFIAWQAVMVIDIAAQRFMQSLSAQLARDPEHARAHIATSRKRLMIIFLPMVAVGIALADWGLSIFGPGYTPAANVLRVLLLGMIPRLIISHELGVRQAQHRGFAFARLQLISTAFVIAVVVFVPIGTADAAGQQSIDHLMPVAIGYALSQLVCAIGVLVPQVFRRAPAPS